MPEFTPNVFIQNLAAICRENLLTEKWLLAPNRRVGNQWVEQVARTGQPAVNLRIMPVRSLVLELSGTKPGTLISRQGTEILISRELARLRERGPLYFTTLEAYPALIRALARSIGDLRAAGINAQALLSPKGTNPKMAELSDLLAGYEGGLAQTGRVDYGGLLKALTDDLRSGSVKWPDGVILLAPDDLEPTGLENVLFDLLPFVAVNGLEPGDPTQPADGKFTDLARLAWMDTPLQAPPPLGDGTLEVLGAVGEVNEARMALRMCLSRGWSLDQVEFLYTDRGTYLPLFFELFARHFPFETGDLDNLPATFSEGIPSIYSRPGKALVAWAQWAMDGFPLQGLAGMVREGLLRLDKEDGQATRTAAADLLIGTEADPGPEAALAAVAAAMKTLKTRPARRFDEDGNELPVRAADRSILRSLESLLANLVKCTPLPGSPLPQVLEAAACFLKTTVRTATQFDEYAAKALALDIAETLKHIKQLGHFPDDEPLLWIVTFVGDVRIAGSGPRAGRVHVAPLVLGGHSGRAHTIVLGLDEGRWPGSDRQEPVLLDRERENLSPHLRLSGKDLNAKENSLKALALRISGTLTLACSLRDLVEDRNIFPSSSLVKAFRVLTDPRADQEALLAHLSPPAGFIDPDSGASLDSSEWWNVKFTGPARVSNGAAMLARRFSNLGKGMNAARERRRLAATPFDGLAGALPGEMDILSDTGPAVSANRLQTLGSCPLRYFFRYVLGIESVEEEPPEPGKWLSAADRGSLLHEIFHVYVDGLIREGRTPDFDRDLADMEKMLDDYLNGHERTSPPPDAHAREYERAQMMQSVRIFLREEESFTRDHEPLYTEASLGLPPTDLPTGLDREEPVILELAPGRRLKTRGRIDRIDRRRSDGAIVITDYKSGSNWLYTRKDPFHQGRLVQHLLYICMVEKCLTDTGTAAHVCGFRFLFPTLQAQGEGVFRTRETLEEGRTVFADLCDLAGEGCFPPTDDEGDCRYCPYALACGDTAAQARRISEKLRGDDPMLAPMRRLRGYE